MVIFHSFFVCLPRRVTIDLSTKYKRKPGSHDDTGFSPWLIVWSWTTPFQAFFFVTLETIKQLSHMLHVMVYLPTFGWLLGQMLVNIPYMDHMGKTTILTGAKRRELSGMIHWLTINNNPSNPQQAIHSLRLAPVSITRVCLKVPESRWSKNVWRNCGDFLVPFSGHISPDEGLQLCIFASRVAPAYCGKW